MLAHVRVFTVHGRSVLILACHVLVLVCMCSYTILGRRMRIPCSGSALEDEKRPILRSPCDRRASGATHTTREARAARHAIIVKISTRCIKVRLVLSSLFGMQTATVRLEAATEKQVAYAQDIATRLNISVPADVLASKALMIRWIDDHKKKKA